MKKSKLLTIAILVVMLILFGIHLQQTQEYLFFFREKLMVFYNDASIIAQRYLGVGGLGLMLTHWLTQFFILDYAGAIITALLGVLSAYMLWVSMPRSKRPVIMLPLFILPFVFQCHALFDIYYSYQGVYRLLADRTSNPNLNILWASILTLLLFYIGGAVGFLLAIYIFVIELIDKPLQSWRLLTPVLIILIVSAICISRGVLPLWRNAITNESYYEPILEATNFFFTSWVLAIVLPLLAPLFISFESKYGWQPVRLLCWPLSQLLLFIQPTETNRRCTR